MDIKDDYLLMLEKHVEALEIVKEGFEMQDIRDKIKEIFFESDDLKEIPFPGFVMESYQFDTKEELTTEILSETLWLALGKELGSYNDGIDEDIFNVMLIMKNDEKRFYLDIAEKLELQENYVELITIVPIMAHLQGGLG